VWKGSGKKVGTRWGARRRFVQCGDSAGAVWKGGGKLGKNRGELGMGGGGVRARGKNCAPKKKGGDVSVVAEGGGVNAT